MARAAETLERHFILSTGLSQCVQARPSGLEVGTRVDRQLARRLAVDLCEGRRLHVHPPEDILLQKLRWYRRGGEVSDRQWRDISAIVRVQGPRLDREYLRDGAGVLGVSDLLERALGEEG